MKEPSDKDQKNTLYLNTSPREEILKKQKELITLSKDTDNNKNVEKKMYEESSDRWFVMVSFCFCLFCNGFQFFTFEPIFNEFSIHYNISEWKIKMFSIIYMIIYPFLCIPEGWFIDSKGIKKGLIIASSFTLIGSFLKIFIKKDKSLITCYIGQILSGLVRPGLLNSPGKIAAEWFSEDKRTIICSICCLSDIAGILVGYLWNLAYVKENSTKEDFEEHIFRYMLSEFILIIILCIPAFFIEKDKPEIPPSPSQKNKNLKNTILKTSLKILFTKKNYIFIIISTFFTFGYYYVMATTNISLLSLYSITRKQSIYIYGLSSAIGFISSVIISFIVDKFKIFKLIIIILCISGTIFQAILTFLLELIKPKNLNAYAIGLIFYSLINATIIPFYTIGMNYACEITYPAGESINGGFMMIMPQLLGIIGTFLFDNIITNHKNAPWITNVILLIFMLFSCIIVIFLDNKLDRNEIDIAGRLKEEKEDEKIQSDKNNQVNVEINQK